MIACSVFLSSSFSQQTKNNKKKKNHVGAVAPAEEAKSSTRQNRIACLAARSFLLGRVLPDLRFALDRFLCQRATTRLQI